MQSNLTSKDIAVQMDNLPFQFLHLVATLICAVALMFDLLEVSFSGVLSAWFSTAPHVAPSTQLGWLMSSVFIGAIIGAPLFGLAADAYGRRFAMCCALAILTLASFGAAQSRGISELTLWRGGAGLALGAFPPLMMAYLTDILPPTRRGAMIFVAIAIAGLGPVGGIFLIHWLLPQNLLGLDAWRWGFIAGGSGAGVATLLFFALPESPRWLQTRGKQEAAQRACARFARSLTLLTSPPAGSHQPIAEQPKEVSIKRRWSLLAFLFFLSPWATSAFPILSGAVMSKKGIQLSDNLLYLSLSNLGPVIGVLLAAFIIDRAGRRTALAFSAGAMIVSGIWFSISDDKMIVAWTIVGFHLFAYLYLTMLNIYSSEQFPTAVRARSMTSAWACNRIGAAIAPLALLPLLRNSGPIAMFSVIGGSLLISVALLAIAPIGKQLLRVE